MKLSTRTRYGMRALLDLAINAGSQPTQLKDVAERQKISLSYLEHLIIPLISAGFVQSTRGSHGGVRLARSPEQIRLDAVMDTLEGPLFPVDCLKDGSCPRSGVCATQDVWDEMRQAMQKVLESKTLQDLVDSQKSKNAGTREMYYI
jgi:Rrf2 family transcriptional regulator, cysteine metabolism repressor